MPTRLRAVIYVPAAATRRLRAECLAYVAACGYVLAAVSSRYADAAQMLDDRDADVLVIHDRSHIPADRLPRLEVVRETTARPRVPGQRRAARLRRWAAGQ